MRLSMYNSLHLGRVHEAVNVQLTTPGESACGRECTAHYTWGECMRLSMYSSLHLGRVHEAVNVQLTTPGESA